jgi:hypothetical protein
MPWVRIDDNFPQHPKVVQVGPIGMALQVAGICYCNRYLTDGFIPNEALNSLLAGCSTEELTLATGKLIFVGLWELADGGINIHDYLEYQSSKEQVEAERARNRIAGQRSAQRRVEQSVQRKSNTVSTHPNIHPKEEEVKETVSKDTAKKVDDEFIQTMILKYGNPTLPEPVRLEIADAVNHKAYDKRKNKQLYVDGWLRRWAERGSNNGKSGQNNQRPHGAGGERNIYTEEAKRLNISTD